MDLTKLSKIELLSKCEELEITKCKSKTKEELIRLIENKSPPTQNIKLIIEDGNDGASGEENTTYQEPPQLELTASGKNLSDANSHEIISGRCNSNNYTIINGDCLIEMRKINEKSIDMILCDLPYGMTKNSWDVVIPFDKLWCEYNRIIKDNGAIVLFGSQPFTSLLITSNLNMFRYCLVWEKNKFSDFLNSKRNQ